MSIFSSLSNASTALQTHGKMVELTGKNISNLNNPNYARQRITVGTFGNSNSSGIQTGPLIATGVQQLRNVFVDKQILNEISHSASLESQSLRLQQLLSSLGESIDRVNDPAFISDSQEQGSGVRSAVDSFFNAFESFSARPSDSSSKQVLFQASKALTESFNRVDQRMDTLEKSLNDEIQGEVSVLNRRLSELSDLNKEISRAESSGGRGASNDLRDQRQAKLEEISEIVLIETREVVGSGGQIEVIARDVDGDPVNLVTVGTTSSDVTFDTSSGVIKSVSTGAVLDLQAGQLSALFQVKEGALTDTRNEMDALANTIATEVNELYYQAFVPAAGATPAIPEISFFAEPTPPPSVSGIPSTVTAGTIALYQGSDDPSVTESISLTAENLRATETEFGGANDLASAIAALASTDQESLGGVSFSEQAILSVVSLGQDISEIENRLDVQKSVQSILTDQRAQISGVSMDEEVANMVQYQRAFQASSRVFNVLSEMLETIVTGLR